VNVSAEDAAGNTGWNNSTSYTATTPDTTDPVVNTVALNDTTPNTGDAILVTVDATDDVSVTDVTADGVSLTPQAGNIWNGTITAVAGTNYVNVSAKDAAGNTGWNNSTSYTATLPDIHRTGGGGGGGTYPPGWFETPTPTVTATKAPIASATGTATDAPSGERVTPTPAKRPDATKTTTPTATETAKEDAPGFTAVFVIAGLLAVAYAMMRRRE
jgi:PGF-CTERM protein